ncbi:HET domain-containing protein [Fusarium sp. LHS14.1]|nr:HET domain-containing protein [Fusarium sp. LHS14.1]
MEIPVNLPYRPLDTGKSEIRLLKFPANDSDNFELTVSLDDNPEYAALSYLWGNPQDQETVFVQGHEVQLMGRIFSSALVVYSWVGPKDYTLAFEALTTLARLLRHNVRDRTDDQLLFDSVTFQLGWLQQDRHLCDPQDQPESPYRGNPWQAIASLASEKYWKRVWVFQEATLARRLLLLSSGDMKLGWEEVQLVTESFGDLALEMFNEDQSKPDFISSQAWEFIEDFYQWNYFDQIVRGKYLLSVPSQHRASYFSWATSSAASHLEATDPKDYIYGLLGITMLPISPDYGPEKSLAELFVEYITGWLDAMCGSNKSSTMPLSFLSVAGVGNFGPSDLPSWVPNYPGNAHLIEPHGFISGYKKELSGNPTRNPYVVKDTQSLFVWGKKMGSIDVASEEPDSNRVQDFYSFIKSFFSRHENYVSGVPSLQAICELLLGRPKIKAVTEKTVTAALYIAFLAPTFDVTDPEPTQELPWHNGWETKLYDFAFPGIDMQELGFGSTPRQDTSWWGTDDRKTVLQYLDNLLKDFNTFALESGYLGTAPLGTKSGDVLCVLEGSGLPLLLRETEEGHYVFVGTTNVLDLDVQSLLSDMGPGGQWFELR